MKIPARAAANGPAERPQPIHNWLTPELWESRIPSGIPQ
jgi:hypothetical protein